MTQKDATFSKEERLKSSKEIDLIFQQGSTHFVYPFKIAFRKEEQACTGNVSVLFTVGKRRFKRAVDRNKIKRYFRESYRKNKQLITKKNQDSTLKIIWVYVAGEILPYKEFEQRMIRSLKELSKII